MAKQPAKQAEKEAAKKEGIFEKLKRGAGDLSELEVQTITGVIETTIQTDPNDESKKGSVLDWEKLIEQTKSSDNAKISLAAATSVKFDGDTNLFISDQARPEALKAHAAAVEAAQQVRQGLVDTFKSAVESAIGLVK